MHISLAFGEIWQLHMCVNDKIQSVSATPQGVPSCPLPVRICHWGFFPPDWLCFIVLGHWVFLTHCCVCEIPLCCVCVGLSLIVLADQYAVVYSHNMFLHSPVMGTWVVSGLGLFWVRLPWTFVHQSAWVWHWALKWVPVIRASCASLLH